MSLRRIEFWGSCSINFYIYKTNNKIIIIIKSFVMFYKKSSKAKIAFLLK